MAGAAEGHAYEVNPRGQVWDHYGGKSVRVEAAAPAAAPAAPKAAAPGDGGEEAATRSSPGWSRGRKLKVLAVASLFLVAIALGARAGLAPKATSSNNNTDGDKSAELERVSSALEDCLAMERERQGSPAPGDADAPADDPDVLDNPDDPDVLDEPEDAAADGLVLGVDTNFADPGEKPDILDAFDEPAEAERAAGPADEGSPAGADQSEKADGGGPARRELRRGRGAGRPGRRTQTQDCKELLAANREGASKSSKTGKSTKATKSSKTTKLTTPTTSKTSKSSTSPDASRKSDASAAYMSMYAESTTERSSKSLKSGDD